MNEPATEDWPARLERAKAHTKKLREEWDEAKRKGRAVRWVRYEYATPPPPPARPTNNEGE